MTLSGRLSSVADKEILKRGRLKTMYQLHCHLSQMHAMNDVLFKREKAAY